MILPRAAELTPYRTAEEAAPLIGLAAQTLLNKAKAHKIRHSRPLGTKLILWSDEDIAAIRAESVVLPDKPAVLEVRPRRKSGRAA